MNRNAARPFEPGYEKPRKPRVKVLTSTIPVYAGKTLTLDINQWGELWFNQERVTAIAAGDVTRLVGVDRDFEVTISTADYQRAIPALAVA